MTRRKIVVPMRSAMPPAAAPPSKRARNPRYIPPQNGRCPVEELPAEVLAYIFELGTRAEEGEEDWEVEEDDGDEDYEDVDTSEDESSDEIDKPSAFLSIGNVKINLGGSDSHCTDATEDPLYLPFQVRMSHVCRRWREIALNTPILWTTLSFSEPSPFEKSKEWIFRSKSCPLDIDVDLTLPDEHFGELSGSDEDEAEDGLRTAVSKDLALILDVVIPHVDRWRSFDLAVSLYKHMYVALKRLALCSGAIQLKTFGLLCYEDFDELPLERFPYEHLKESMLLFGGNTPMLVHAELWGVHVDWKMFIPLEEQSLVSLQVAPSVTTSLTELELAYHVLDVRPSLDEFCNILRCAPNLSSLKLRSSGPGRPEHGPAIQPLFLPNLRALTLAFLEEAYAIWLLRLFHAPGLTYLCLDFETGMYTDFVKRLAAPMQIPSPTPSNFKDLIVLPPESSDSTERRIIDPSKPASILANVVELKLSGLQCVDGAADTLYTACPRLKRLFLNMHFVSSQFFEIFLHYDGLDDSTGHVILMDNKGDPVCRQLEALTVSGMDGSDIVALVERRKLLGLPIRELYIDEIDMDSISPMDDKWLRKNVRTIRYVEISDDEEGSVVDDDEDDDGDDDENEDEEGDEELQLFA